MRIGAFDGDQYPPDAGIRRIEVMIPDLEWG